MAFSTDRRSFLKTSAAGAAGIALASGGLKAKAADSPTNAWSPKKQINPEIDNLRTVSCYDPTMISGNVGSVSWNTASQVTAVLDADKIKKNVNEMAKALAQKSDITEAWKTIFHKPADKEWSEVVAAIKTNAVKTWMTPQPTIAAIVEGLKMAGVSASNIYIYDCNDNPNGSNGTGYDKEALGGANVCIFAQAYGNNATDWTWKEEYGHTTTVGIKPGIRCAGFVAKATNPDLQCKAVDILVSAAVNRGHSNWNGWTSLSMKNHYGTFLPHGGDPEYPTHSSMGYIFEMNKHVGIIGGNPVRQQLCVVDSLFSAMSNPHTHPQYMPGIISMGTWAPALDYQVIKNVRAAAPMNDNRALEEYSLENKTPIATWPAVFGYTQEEFDTAGNWIEVDPAEGWDGTAAGKIDTRPSIGGTPNLKISVKMPSGYLSGAELEIKAGDNAEGVTIHDVRGREIRKYTLLPHHTSIMWDGKDQSGTRVAPGSYVVRAFGTRTRSSATLLYR